MSDGHSDYAKRHGMSVNSQFTGHGIGRKFHQPPWILHYRQSLRTDDTSALMAIGPIGNHEAGEMQIGGCFTIEPCLVQGSNARGDLWDDGWTMATEVREGRLR